MDAISDLHTQNKIDVLLYNDTEFTPIIQYGLQIHKKYEFSPSFNILHSIPFNLYSSNPLFTLLTDNCISTYSGQTHLDTSYSFVGNLITHFVYVPYFEIYVALIDSNVLKLYTSTFDEYYSIEYDKCISTLICNDISSNAPNILTCSPGAVCLWMFRLGGKKLTSRLEHAHIMSKDEIPNCVELEDIPGNLQKCFISVGNSVIVFQLESGNVLYRLNNIHDYVITCILYIRPLRILVTADSSGKLKIWNSVWSLLHSLVGHMSEVLCLCFIQMNGPLVISSSRDNSFRAWDIDTGDILFKHTVDSPINTIHTSSESEYVYFRKSHSIEIWKKNSIYSLYKSLPSTIVSLNYTSHPVGYVQSVSIDGLVYLIPIQDSSSFNFFFKKHLSILASILVGELNLLFLLTATGSILILSISTFPMQVKKVITYLNYTINKFDLKHSQKLFQFTSFCIYKDMTIFNTIGKISISLNKNDWKSLQAAAILFAGCSNGDIVALEHNKGTIIKSYKAHSSSLIKLICHSDSKQIISFCEDRIIKIWRIYAYNLDTLIQLGYFELEVNLTHAVISKNRLCITLNIYEKAEFSVIMFNILARLELKHDIEADHQNTIVDLSVNNTLELFITCSLDKSLRIWNENNSLIKIIILNVCPINICFSHENLVFSLRNHLYIIHSNLYLPHSISQRLLTDEHSQDKFDNPINFIGPLEQDVISILNNLRQPENSRASEDNVEKIISDDIIEYQKTLKAKEILIININSRQIDIEDIKNSTYNIPEKALKSKGRDVAKYNKKVPQDLINRIYSRHKDYSHTICTYFQFIPKESDIIAPNANIDPSKINIKHAQNKYFIPNSIIRNELSHQDLKNDDWSPPSLTNLQLHLLSLQEESINDEIASGDLTDSMEDKRISKFEYGYTSNEPDLEVEPEIPEVLDSITQINLSQKANIPLKKPALTKINYTRNSSVPKIIPPKPKFQDIATTNSPVIITPNDSITKSIDSEIVTVATAQVPEYISQFIGSLWFDKLFYNYSNADFEKMNKVGKFIAVILEQSNSLVDYSLKTKLLSAFLLLNNQSKLSLIDKKEIVKYIQNTLLSHNGPICHIKEQKLFIINAIHLMVFYSKSVNILTLAHIVVQFINGDLEIKELVNNYFVKFGIDDKNNILFNELNNIFGVNSSNVLLNRNKLFDNVQDWLNNVQDTYTTLLNKDTNVNITTDIQFRRNEKVSHNRAIATKSNVDNLELIATDTMCIDSINFFLANKCLQNIESRNDNSNTSTNKLEKMKHKSVPTLPYLKQNIELIRIGGTHHSQCHPDRETILNTFNKLPPISYGINHSVYIKVPMQKQNILLCGSVDHIYTKMDTFNMEKKKYFYLDHSRLT